MMKYALFLGCNIPARVKQYDLSARSVLKKLGVDVVDIREFNCCGYPMKNSDFKTSLLFSARNLALAEKENLAILTLCQCCFGTLKKAAHLFKEDIGLKDEVNAFLSTEGLSYHGKVEVNHFLSMLHKEISTTAIKEKISNGFKKLKVAAHHGCHALRPSDVMQFDDPVAPVLFDELINVTGAESVDWSMKTECCGAPLLGINDDLVTIKNVEFKIVSHAWQQGFIKPVIAAKRTGRSVAVGVLPQHPAVRSRTARRAPARRAHRRRPAPRRRADRPRDRPLPSLDDDRPRRPGGRRGVGRRSARPVW